MFPDECHHYTCRICVLFFQAGESRCVLGLSAIDPDNFNQVNALTYDLLPGNNSQRFNYVDTRDQLTFAVDYDVDNGVMPQNVIVTIEARDAQGLTATSQITITVADINDNTCRFSNEIQTTTVNQGTALGMCWSLSSVFFFLVRCILYLFHIAVFLFFSPHYD